MLFRIIEEENTGILHVYNFVYTVRSTIDTKYQVNSPSFYLYNHLVIFSISTTRQHKNEFNDVITSIWVLHLPDAITSNQSSRGPFTDLVQANSSSVKLAFPFHYLTLDWHYNECENVQIKIIRHIKSKQLGRKAISLSTVVCWLV